MTTEKTPWNVSPASAHHGCHRCARDGCPGRHECAGRGSRECEDQRGWLVGRWDAEAFKRFLCQVVAPGAKVRDKGRIQSQPASTGDQSPGLTPDGWDWVPDEGAHGSEVVDLMQYWLGAPRDGLMGPPPFVPASHYGLTMDGVLDGPSPAITALQETVDPL